MTAKHVTDTNFQSEVLDSDVPVLVDFWSPSCGPCLAMGPSVDELAGEFDGTAKVVKVNVHEAPRAAAQYGVTAIPYFVVIKDGEIKDQMTGMRHKEELRGRLKAASDTQAA